MFSSTFLHFMLNNCKREKAQEPRLSSGLRRGGEASPQAPHAYDDARLYPAHDEREEEDDVPGGDAQVVELGQVAELPDNVGGHAPEMVEQSVVLEEGADYTVP